MLHRSALSLAFVATLLISSAAPPAFAASSLQAAALPTTLQSNPPWALDRIDQRPALGDSAYRHDTSGAGVTVYVLDSGIRFSNTEFGGRAVSGWDFVDNDADASDCNGHGTKVASIIGGSTYGVAKEAKLVSLRIFDCNGVAQPDDVQSALDWIYQHKSTAPAVVISDGSSWSPGSAVGPEDQYLRNIMAPGVGNGSPGIPVVTEAGDGSANACDYSPGDLPQAITVGATDSSDARAAFSNWGTCIDLFAPGVNIQSATNTSDSATASSDGTGFAAAVVTGIVARYLQVDFRSFRG